MGAKKKEVKEWKAADLQPAGLGPVAPALEIVALEALPPRPPGRILTGDPKDMARELVRTLREDVKAI
jgi:electron transfer flavoprotein alpha/beta subunit